MFKLKTNQWKEREFESLDKLECDNCGAFICYVHDFDLNGSYFFCKDCINPYQLPPEDQRQAGKD